MTDTGFRPDRPIYQQLIDKISGEIIQGKRKPGDKLPSVREYAVETGVNVNTMHRVYREMEQQGIVTTKRGQGTYVTEDKKRLNQLRNELKQKQIHTFVNDMMDFGFSIEEMVEELLAYRERMKNND